jgi:radical SAM superfamily enzyme with C-terminal helix-hairpin-helix motif
MTTYGSGSDLDRIVIVDGYVDEPTCLGVPPYISTYPRYIAGAIWTHSPHTDVMYQTIDQIRMNLDSAQRMWASSDIVILIAGMIVPGKYLGGTPISVREARVFFSDARLSSVPKLLVGPWARFGCGQEGGRLATSSELLSPPFTYIVTGDSEVVLGELLRTGESLDSIDLRTVREDASQIEEYVRRGTRIVSQHPSYTRGHIICEIETYRGCPRYITGGCSFCTEPLYGAPQQRTPEAIIREIALLYQNGVRAFRVGRQADLFTFGSKEMGHEEFPVPSPEAIESLFSGIRKVAPDVNVLHIDNVNPGTLAHHPEESRMIAKTIIKYHTPGDVAAFGVESLDPEVRRRNNLKVSAEEALDAVRLLNEVGVTRPDWGLPHLLPGINLLYGLLGESARTIEYNMTFLKQLLEENLLVRRINIRQVIGFPDTLLSGGQKAKMKHSLFLHHKEEVREQIDIPMLQRVAPYGTIITSAFVEVQRGNSHLLRPLATYPILCQMPDGVEPDDIMDVFVVDHGPRSVTVLPYPLSVERATLSQWRAIPGVGVKRAARLKSRRVSSVEEIERELELEIPDWLRRSLSFE